jgi:hypothetical protein
MDWIHLTHEGLSAEGLGTNELQAFPTVNASSGRLLTFLT